MKTLLKKLILSFVLIFATSMNIGAKVVSYPVPQTDLCPLIIQLKSTA